jgi:hypothetical protein
MNLKSATKFAMGLITLNIVVQAFQLVSQLGRSSRYNGMDLAPLLIWGIGIAAWVGVLVFMRVFLRKLSD